MVPSPTPPRTVGVGSLSVGWVAGWLAGGLPAQLAGRLSANFFFAPAAGLLFVGRGGAKKARRRRQKFYWAPVIACLIKTLVKKSLHVPPKKSAPAAHFLFLFVTR